MKLLLFKLTKKEFGSYLGEALERKNMLHGWAIKKKSTVYYQNDMSCKAYKKTNVIIDKKNNGKLFIIIRLSIMRNQLDDVKHI